MLYSAYWRTVIKNRYWGMRIRYSQHFIYYNLRDLNGSKVKKFFKTFRQNVVLIVNANNS